MATAVLEAVPNFSEGRDSDTIAALAAAMRGAGADVADRSSDPDHHRSVFTLLGPPAAVEAAVLAAAAVAVERIDLRRHEGVHPRIGALDVLPFVPLAGLTMADARASARRVARRLADELGLPVYYYAEASEPPGRGLAALRRGGFETLAAEWPAERTPDVLPAEWPHPGAHPTAGAVCVGARGVLLAWNVYLDGVPLDAARGIAGEIRERDGGFRGVRALALELPRRDAVQISMNVEDVQATPPMSVFRRIEALAGRHGGRTAGTEVIGLLPDELVASAAGDRLALTGDARERMLSRRMAEHLVHRDDTVVAS